MSRSRPAGRRRVMALASGAGLTAALAVAVPGTASAAPAALPANCSLAGGIVSCTYGYTGAEQTFTVPPGFTSVSVTAVGAAGSASSHGEAGGEGAKVTGTLTGLSGGQTLYVEVGQTVDTASLPETAVVAAFNGGGAGFGIFSGAGGGASDVRTISRTATGTLASRLIVAGGGGGHSDTEGPSEAPANAGQNAPPATANDGQGQGGLAGTQTAGGAGGQGALGNPASTNCDGPGPSGSAGSLGQGGKGAVGGPSAGGGGGGLYGGGGGGGGDHGDLCVNPPAAGGGGGGSSLVPAGGSASVTSAAASVTISYIVDNDLAIASHPNITVNATSPAGAVVDYSAPAVTDPDDTSPPAAVCTPASGRTFAIGTTTVTCTATDSDDADSPVSTTFTVTVVGAAGQLAALYQAVQGLGPGLANTALIAEHAVASGNTGTACLALSSFIIQVATHVPPLPPATVGELVAAAAQIQAVLGC